MNKHNQYCYTYLLGWRDLDIWYYGSRSANKLEPQKDLLFKYQTSSVHVKKFILENGLPDVVKVHKLFETKVDAETYETKFLKKVNAKTSQRWLNKSNNTFPHVCYTRTEKHKLLISNANKGRIRSRELKEKLSKIHNERFQHGAAGPNKGKKFSDEWKRKISESNKGKHSKPVNLGRQHTDETKKKISSSLQGIKRSAETKEKVSLSKRGVAKSDEFKQKRSDYMKEHWRKKKLGLI